MTIDDIGHMIFEGFAYDVIKYFVGPAIITAAATVIMKKAFHKLGEHKETLYFVVASFLVVCTLFYFVGATRQGPLLTGGIQSVITGSRTGEHNTFAVINLSIVNTGSMQTVVTNWMAEAETPNGTKFNGYIVPRPGDLTFNTSGHGEENPDLVTYKAVDNILEKSVNPVQTGALLAGNLVVAFQNVEPSVFQAGVLITVTYQDALGHKYTSNTRSGGGPVSIPPPAPGTHTEMVCRAPPELLRSLQQLQPAMPPSTPIPQSQSPKG